MAGRREVTFRSSAIADKRPSSRLAGRGTGGRTGVVICMIHGGWSGNGASGGRVSAYRFCEGVFASKGMLRCRGNGVEGRWRQGAGR